MGGNMWQRRIVVTGSRDWNSWGPIYTAFNVLCLGVSDVLGHGNQRGADKMAGKVAKNYGMVVRPFDADWEQFGKNAGPIRNGEMLSQIKPHLVLAFHNDISHSKGTKDCVRRARELDIPVLVICDETEKNLDK